MNRKTSSKIPVPVNLQVPVIVIFAPTASGKTALTRELFSPGGSHFIFKGEIVSADSQAIYRGMDIGTAKPSPEFCRQVPHHLIDLISPDIQFNVSDWVDMADESCQKIYERGNTPVVCGGTGFYIRNFLFGVPKTPMSDEKLRKELKERIKVEGNQKLHDELAAIDPLSAAKIHVNDAYRICRALEVYYLSGKPRGEFLIDEKPTLRDCYDFTFIVLQPDRELLYERIRRRVDLMFEEGLEKEVRTLVDKGYGKESPGMKAIGYSEWFDEGGKLRPSSDIENIKEEVKHHSCKYAKKQYTYIRDIPGSRIVDFDGSGEAVNRVREVISNR